MTNILDSLHLFDKHLLKLWNTKSVLARKRRCDAVREFFDYHSRIAQDAQIEQITGRDIEDYLRWCWKRGIGYPRRRHKLHALRKFYRFLMNASVVTHDPTADVNLVDPALNDLAQVLSRDEVLRMFRMINASTEKGLRDAVLLIMFAFCGLTVREAIGMNIEDVVDGKDEMYLSVVKSKRGKTRKVFVWKAPAHYVRSLLLARLSQGAKANDPLMTSYKKNGQPRGNRRLDGSSCDDTMQQLATLARIRKPITISPHILRLGHIRDLQRIIGNDSENICTRIGLKHKYANHYFTCQDKFHQRYASLQDYWDDFSKLALMKGEHADQG